MYFGLFLNEKHNLHEYASEVHAVQGYITNPFSHIVI